MSTYNNANDKTRTDKDSNSGAADAVRQAFASLPFEQKISTLIRVELDMLGDAVNTVMSAASRAADEMSKAFTEAERPPAGGSTASSGPTS
jgi:DNA-directed RNA polymerase specialized sigma24 family protein